MSNLYAAANTDTIQGAKANGYKRNVPEKATRSYILAYSIERKNKIPHRRSSTGD